MLKKTFSQTLVYSTAALVIFVDQLAKHLVRTNLALNERWMPWEWLRPYARILRINNTGAAFGMFRDSGMVFMVIAIVVSIIIVYYSWRLPPGHNWLRLTLGLQLGGALGNLIDRLVFGTVTDFISVHTFAVFNVADASITVGVALLMVLMLGESLQKRRDKLTAGSSAPSSTDAATSPGG